MFDRIIQIIKNILETTTAVIDTPRIDVESGHQGKSVFIAVGDFEWPDKIMRQDTSAPDQTTHVGPQ